MFRNGRTLCHEGFWVIAMSMGFAVSFLEQEKQEFVLKFFNYMTELFIKVMTGIMYIAPIGVFCLMADATGSFGYAVLAKILYLIALYVVVLAIVTYVMIGGSVAMFSKCTTYRQFFRSKWKVQVFAFSTASSIATLLVVAVLVSAGLPIDALPILFGVDRIFDMLRTAVNITGDAACATIVDQFRTEERTAA